MKLAIPLLLFLASAAHAQTIWYLDAAGSAPGTGTPADPYTSIQYAIDQPSTVDGDELEIADGTYLELVDLSGKALVLRGADGPRPTLHGGGMGSVISVTSGEPAGVELRHLRITGGIGTLDGSGRRGGGVYVDQVEVTIVDCLFVSNRACGGGGGGVYSQAGDVTLQDCVFRDNRGTPGGALMVMGGQLVSEDCLFEENTTQLAVCSSSSDDGGAIYAYNAVLECTNGTFLGNACPGSGGAVYSGGSNVGSFLESCLLEGNGLWEGARINRRGGGVSGTEHLEVRNSILRGNESYLNGGGALGVTLIDCWIEENVSLAGGGTYDAVAYGCTYWRNHAVVLNNNDAKGGACFSGDLYRCLVWGNTCQDEISAIQNGGIVDRCTVVGNLGGGGLPAIQAGTVSNTICWGNRTVNPDLVPPQVTASVELRHSLVEGLDPLDNGNLAAQPLLFGQHVGDLHLLPGSPAIDAGDPALPLDPDGSPADIGALPFDPAYRTDASRFCVAKETSTGCTPSIGLLGAPTLSGPPAWVVVNDVPAGQFGLLILAAEAQALPLSGGTLCLAPPLIRGTPTTAVPAAGCGDALLLTLDPALMGLAGVVPGDLLFAQSWFRDPQHPDGTGVGLSDGLVLTVLP